MKLDLRCGTQCLLGLLLLAAGSCLAQQNAPPPPVTSPPAVNPTSPLPPALPPVTPPSVLGGKEYRLRMKNLHTGESIDVAYRRGEQYLDQSIALLDHFLRDYRTGDDAHYDVHEFDLLHDLMQKLHRPNGLIDVVCGYRTEATNEYLRTRSPVTGVAENSQHILSKAIDIQVPGVSTRRVRDAALSLGEGGVGYYPVSHFVHVDVGPVRQWSFPIRTRHLRRTRYHHRRRAS